MRFINPGSFGVVILCFLLPFLSIKCNGVKLATFSGVQMATGADINAGDQGMFGKKIMNSSSITDKRKMLSYPLLATLVILLAAGTTILVLTLKGREERKIRKLSSIFHGVVIFGLLAELARMEYSIMKVNEKAELGPITLSWGLDIGFYLALLIPIGIIIYNIVELRKPVVTPIIDENPPQQSDEGQPPILQS